MDVEMEDDISVQMCHRNELVLPVPATFSENISNNFVLFSMATMLFSVVKILKRIQILHIMFTTIMIRCQML